MAINRAQLAKELEPGLHALFGMEYARYDQEDKEIYDTESSERAFEEEEFTKRNEDVNNNLIRAQNIVTELQSSLDMSVPGELPGTLYRLYDYVMHQLQQANLKKEAEPIDEAEKVITELRDAWSEMLSQNPENEISGDQQPGSLSLKA